MARTTSFCALSAAALASAAASAQTTVPFTSSGWDDFGSATITSASGNFWAGWTTLNATPDVGDVPFAVPVQTLSGLAGDSALWLNNFDTGDPSYPVVNEVAGLSLSGFTPGQTYSLFFFATIAHYSAAGWTANIDDIQVGLTGATISTWDSTVLTDSVDNDGLNTWDPQLLTFTATSSIVEFRFGDGATSLTGQGVSRFGLDGFRIIPAPSSLALLGLGGLVGARRRR